MLKSKFFCYFNSHKHLLNLTELWPSEFSFLKQTIQFKLYFSKVFNQIKKEHKLLHNMDKLMTEESLVLWVSVEIMYSSRTLC